VAEDLSIGIVGLQGAEKGDEGMLLGRGAGVGRGAVLVKTALVADTDAVRIILWADVSTNHLFGAADVQLTVAGDVVVVTAALPAFSLMTGIQRLKGERAVATGCRAVNHNQINLSHGLQMFDFRLQTLESLARLHEERADDGGEHGDDELDDGFPSLQVFEKFHKIKFSVCVGFVG